MTLVDSGLLFVAGAILVYLFYALIHPEKF